jgi:hypothetical protein
MTMRKLWLTTLLTLACVSQATAQNSKWDFNLSLSHALQKANSGTLLGTEDGESFTIEPCTAEGVDDLGPHLNRIFCDRRNFHGFNLGAKYNLSPTLGIRTDVSAYFDKDRSVDSFGEGADLHTDTNTFNDKTYVLVIGPEVRHEYGNWIPFVHGMAGVARQTSVNVQTSTGPGPTPISWTG